MRIAYLSTFYPFKGGIAQFNASLYKAFAEKGHEVKVFTFSLQYPGFLYPGKSQYVSPDENAEKIDSIEILNTINPFSYIKTAKKIKEFAPDLLIMKFWLPFFGPSLGYVSKRVGKKAKVIAILDNVIPHEKRIFDKTFTRYFLKRCHGYVVMSDAVKNDLYKFIPDAKVLFREHPLYNHFGEKTDKMTARKKLGVKENSKLILFFGLIRDYKGLDLLIEAFGKLDDSYELLIAGESYGSFDKYTELINKSSLKSNIHLHNRYISDQEVSTFFSASDVSVLPYKSATQSGITSIAFHFELPVIATDVGGLKEIVQPGKYGLITDNPNSVEITQAIKNYFDNNLGEELRKNILIKKKEESWENFAEAMIKLKGILH